MSDLNNKFQNLMKDLENNLESKKDFEYVKKAFEKFFSDINSNIEKRMSILEESQKELEFKINKFDETLNKIQDELYIDDEYENDYTFEIVCPYCNYTFETEIDELKTDLKCPECNNIIELDWNEDDFDDSCSGNCSHCNSCNSDDDDSDDDM